MSYTAILVPVCNDPVGRPALEAAALLAREFDAALIGYGAEYYLPSGPTGISAGMLAMAEADVIQTDLQAAGQIFHAATEGLPAGREWRCSVELPMHAFIRQAPSADLIVIGALPKDRGDIYRAFSPGDAIMQAGRPVLRVGPGGLPLPPATIAVAWKNTREARRAIADALPFLHRADTVLIYTVVEDQDDGAANQDLDEVVAYLGRRGVKAKPCPLPRGRGAGDTVLAAATLAGADLIVAGAYGRSRVREWIFGGVTQTLLDQQAVPVLFSH